MEDYDQPNNDQVDFTLESFELPDNDQVNFAPGEPEQEPVDVGPGPSPIDLPMGISLPTSISNLLSMNLGVAVFILATHSLLLGVAAFLRNYAAIIMGCVALLALIFSGLFALGLEMYWGLVALTIILLIAGAVVRWTQ